MAHIGISVVAVGAGLGALTTRKGGRRHRRFGRVYVYSIGFVVGSAIVLASLRWSPFLLLVAVFSFLGYLGWLVRSTTLPEFLPALLGVSIGYFPLTDMWAFRTSSSESQQWFFSHLVRMATSYFVTIATVSITNIEFLPLAVRPLWPAIIGVPIVGIWLRRYRHQLPQAVAE